MKLKLAQKIALAIAVLFAGVLVYDAPFHAAAASAASSQVVYAPINEPPVIANEPAKLDYSLLALELFFVAFVGGAICFAAGQYRTKR